MAGGIDLFGDIGKIASEAEAIAGDVTNKLMTPYLSKLHVWGSDGLPLNIRKLFGAVGRLDSNDTAAIDDMFAYYETTYAQEFQPGDPLSTYTAIGGPSFFFPNGEYHYAGVGFQPNDTASRYISLEGEGIGHSSIVIDADIDFIKFNPGVQPRNSIRLIDLKFIGGTGIYINLDEDNPAGEASTIGTFVQRCAFINQKSIAIGCLWDNGARQHFSDNIFLGARVESHIGLLMPNKAAFVNCHGNWFEGYKYGIKVYPGGQGSYNIGPNNGFLNLGDGAMSKKADIWICAMDPLFVDVGTGQVDPNVGQGLRILGNRFSNETMSGLTGFSRILIADENTAIGADPTKHPHLEAATTKMVHDMYIEQNSFTGTGTVGTASERDRGIVYSFTPKLGRGAFMNNYVTAGYPYLVHFDASVVNAVDGSYGWEFHFENNNNGGTGWEIPQTNRPGIGALRPGFGDAELGGLAQLSRNANTHDPSLVILSTSDAGNGQTMGGGVTRVNVNDEGGRTIGAEYTFSVAAATDFIALAVSAGAAVKGETVFVEFFVKKAATQTMDNLKIRLRIVGDGGTISDQFHTVKLVDKWRKIRIPVRFYDDIASITPAILGDAFVTIGTKDKFQLGSVDVYIADHPVNTGRLASTRHHWQSGRINLGGDAGGHMWWDILRGNLLSYKFGAAPGNSSDGSLVEPAARYQTIATDAVFTLTPFTTPSHTRHTGTLTANRLVTLSTTGAVAGVTRWVITRTGGGAFNLDIGGLKNLATGQWCEVVYDGAAYYLAAFGAL